MLEFKKLNLSDFKAHAHFSTLLSDTLRQWYTKQFLSINIVCAYISNIFIRKLIK